MPARSDSPAGEQKRSGSHGARTTHGVMLALAIACGAGTSCQGCRGPGSLEGLRLEAARSLRLLAWQR